LLLAIFSLGVNAQYALPADFETAEEDTVWAQFANAGDAAENLILADNPDNAGINTSDKCLNFIVLADADPWAGAWSEAYGAMEFTEDNHILQMMVYKDVISNCGLKIETGGDPVEVKVPNTVTGAWELLTFDFTDAIGITYARLVFFPDFPDTRSAGSTCYIDNIGWEGATSVRKVNGAYISVFPNPATEMLTVQYPDMRGITITNLAGQRIRSLEFQTANHRVIEISDLVTGLYFVTLETANGPVTSRFIKK